MRLNIFQSRPVKFVNYPRAVANMSKKYRNEMDHLEKQVEDMRNGLDNIEKELSESKDRAVSLRSLAVKYRKELELSALELTTARTENKRLEQENEELKRKLAGLGVVIQLSNSHRIVDTVNGPPSDATSAPTVNLTSCTAVVNQTGSTNSVSSSTHQHTSEASDSTPSKSNAVESDGKENVDHDFFKNKSEIAKIWTATPGEEMQFTEMTRLRKKLKDEESRLKEQTENSKRELDEVLKRACSLRSLAIKYKKELEYNSSELANVLNQNALLEQENEELKTRLAELGVPWSSM